MFMKVLVFIFGCPPCGASWWVLFQRKESSFAHLIHLTCRAVGVLDKKQLKYHHFSTYCSLGNHMRLFWKSRRNGPSEVALLMQRENAQRWKGDNQDAGMYVGDGKVIICPPDYDITAIALGADELASLLREVVIASKNTR